MPIGSSGCFSDFASRKTSRGRAWVWRVYNALSAGTAAGSGWKRKLTRERRFISRCGAWKPYTKRKELPETGVYGRWSRNSARRRQRERRGAGAGHAARAYEPAQTPFDRVLASPAVAPQRAASLQAFIP